MLYWWYLRRDFFSLVLPSQLGAAVNAVTHAGETPLHLAALHGKVAAVEVLVEMDADVELRKDKGDTPVHCAAFGGHDAVLGVLKTLRCFAKAVNAVDHAGASPLHKAAHRGWHTTARLLVVDLGADVNKTMDKDCRTALHLASFQGHGDTIRTLVKDCGADVDAVTTAKATALHYAAMGGHAKAVTILLAECGANVMAKMNGGRTALHLASLKGHMDVVHALVGQLLGPKDDDGKTPADLAKRSVQDLVMSFFQ